MKKYLGLLAFPIMLMTGCAKENTLDVTPDNPDNNPVEKVLTFTGIINGTNGSRTAFGEYNKGEYGVFWTAGDNISVYTKSGKQQIYDLTGGAGSAKGTFTFVDDVADITAPNAHYAVYPNTLNTSDYDAAKKHDYKYSFSDGKLTLDLSNLKEQTYNPADDQAGADKFQLTKSVMTAKSTDTTLKFENALAMLHVNICAGEEENFENFTVHEIKLTAGDGQPLWGAGATIDMNGNNPKAVIPANPGQNVITLKLPEGGLVIEEDCAELGNGNNYDSNYNYNLGGRDFYILLPAGTYGNFKLEAKVSCDYIGTAEEYKKYHEFTLTNSWKEITFERSYINSFHRSIDALISYDGIVYADILDANTAASNTNLLELEIARQGKLYWPFFESLESKLSKVDKDVVLKGTETNRYLEIADPTCAPTYFTTLNEHTFTVEDVEFRGEISVIGLGHYYEHKALGYNTIMNNVTIDGIKVRKWANGSYRCAVFNYGKTGTLNNCTIINSECSENCAYLVEADDWKSGDRLYHENYLGLSEYELERLTYDLGTQNGTKLILNDCTIGKIAIYEHGALEVNASTVKLITDCSNMPSAGALISINKGSTVTALYLTGETQPSKYLYSNVKIAAGATVNTLIITDHVKNDAQNQRNIEIEAGAIIDEIVFDGKTYTSSEFTFSDDRKTITFTKDGSSIDFVIDNIN